MSRNSRLAAVLIFAILPGCAASSQDTRAQPAKPNTLKEVFPGFLVGYLPTGSAPNPLLFLPPPPSPGSSSEARDQEASRDGLALRDSLRWQIAAVDADLTFPNAPHIYSCTIGTDIDETRTPHLYLLMRRTMTDLGLATYPAKTKYARKRPFLENGQPICTPQDNARLARDGSYPSGHSAIGFGWSLLLTEIAPDKAAELIARGRAMGDSRRVCNVHWLSDIEEGRTTAAATVARLHGIPEFESDLRVARQELAKARADGKSTQVDCVKEAEALAQRHY